MISRLVSELKLPISEIRLERYRPDNGTDLEMVINYFWNIELSKALYPSLQALEVSLRNSIHTAAMHKHDNDPFWFDRPNVLLARQLAQIREARGKLDISAKGADDIVAALTFGFWVGLFNSLYESPLPPAHPNQLSWLDERSRPTPLFGEAFPHIPKKFRSRKALTGRCNKFLKLRNRVFHHEPIWKYSWLPRHHIEVLETIGWISPVMRETITLCDDFVTGHAAGKATLELKLKNHLGML